MVRGCDRALLQLYPEVYIRIYLQDKDKEGQVTIVVSNAMLVVILKNWLCAERELREKADRDYTTWIIFGVPDKAEATLKKSLTLI